jgi:hypothetical protein
MINKTDDSPERIRELLERNLQEVFGENDGALRQAAIKELWAEDGVLYVPPGVITGHEAIDKFAGITPVPARNACRNTGDRIRCGTRVAKRRP